MSDGWWPAAQYSACSGSSSVSCSSHPAQATALSVEESEKIMIAIKNNPHSSGLKGPSSGLTVISLSVRVISPHALLCAARLRINKKYLSKWCALVPSLSSAVLLLVPSSKFLAKLTIFSKTFADDRRLEKYKMRVHNLVYFRY